MKPVMSQLKAIEIDSFRKEDLGEREDEFEGLYGYKPVGGSRARHLLDRDIRDDHRGELGKRRTYGRRELLSGEWLYIVDNEFARNYYRRINQREPALEWPAATEICHDCNTFQTFTRLPRSEIEELTIGIAKLREVGDSCDLCGFLLRCISRHHLETKDSVDIFRDGSVFKLERYSKPIFTVLADPSIGQVNKNLQIGSPSLPSLESWGYFELLRTWLSVCDEHHDGYGCHLEAKSILPTRVLDVGVEGHSNIIRLYCSTQNEQEAYVALSHCWGKLTSKQGEFRTLKENINQRYEMIKVNELPKTFQDAIRVTRELGKRYLWIDSLCIIQDDVDDWETESKMMKTLYNMAYCTIAATSSRSSAEGFLGPRRQRDFVKIEALPELPPSPSSSGSDGSYVWHYRRPPPRHLEIVSRSGGQTIMGWVDTPPPELPKFPLYVCQHIDDFTTDVEESILNSRAWVLQERALSRRILHFAATQTYWECGVGVHCETLTLMYNSQTNILGDPQFPSSAGMRTNSSNLSLFKSIFEQYTQLDLTYPADRAVAFSGLESRLADALKSTIRYGIIEDFFHRCLLWQRRGDEPLQRIPPGKEQKQKVPSWSWMGHDGKIDFMEIAGEQVAWSQAVFFPSGNELRCMVREFRDCRIERSGQLVATLQDGHGYSGDEKISDSGNSEGVEDTIEENGRKSRGSVTFDNQSLDRSCWTLKCVVIGRQQDYYSGEFGRCCYVMVVRPNDAGYYERVGVGSVDKRHVFLERPGTESTVL